MASFIAPTAIKEFDVTQLLAFLADQPILLVFALIGVGMALGNIKLKGISLGAAAVLFLGIALPRRRQAQAAP